MSFKLMKLVITLIVFWSSSIFASPSSEQICSNYVSNQDNIKSAHLNDDCLKAANDGSGMAQYSVGLSYGYAGQSELEEKHYRLAANNRIVAAYLALGHIKRDKNTWESIYWYQRFVGTKTNGYGYAALQLSELFALLGDQGQSKYWIGVCKSSAYGIVTIKYTYKKALSPLSRLGQPALRFGYPKLNVMRIYQYCYIGSNYD